MSKSARGGFILTHILSFTATIVLCGWSLRRMLSAPAVNENIIKLELALYILITHAVFATLQYVIIKHCKYLRRLSFYMPSLLLVMLFADLIFFRCGIEFFLAMSLVIYGVGALYTGFRSFLLFVLFSQCVFIFIFKINSYLYLITSGWNEIYPYIPVTVSSFIFVLVLGMLAYRSKKAYYGAELCKTIMTNSPNAVVFVNKEMRVAALSYEFTRLFRTGVWQTCIGRPLVDLLPSGAKQLAAEIAVCDGIKEMLKEIKIDNNNGYYRVICRKLEDGSQNTYITIVNITPIMKAKLEVEKAVKTKDIFLAKMSHEIRTPLNAITGMSELILRDEFVRQNASTRVREYASGVKSASTNLISIINDILDFTKIESGNMEIVEKSYKTETLLSDVLNIISMRLLEKPVFFVTKIDSSIPESLIGDVVRLRQILINMLNNAVKYTQNGFIELYVRTEKTNSELVILKASVSDSGLGIREKDLKKIFEEFVQLDVQNNGGTEGSGLGLAVSRSLCRAMGGDISVESVWGQGSVFTVTLPQRATAQCANIAEVEFPETKKTIVYDGRELSAASMAWSLKNLNVEHKIVTNFVQLSELFTKDESAGCNLSHVFTAAIFYESVRDLVEKYSHKTKVVALAEAGETAWTHNALGRSDREQSACILPMPAHTISIARILNNKSCNYSNNEDSKLNINWTAPQAHVLIVDDINTNIVVTEGLMSPYKMNIYGANSGKKAIELVQQRHFDIIFMDHMMPELDGIETVICLKMLPNARGVPIIALTANAIHGVEEMFVQNGFAGLLVKPIEMQKLHELLEKYIPNEKRKKIEPDNAPNAPNDMNTIDISRDILNVYYDEGIVLLEKLKSALAGHDIKLLTTYVHGIKSSSANIGEFEISQLAKELEDAGKKEDMSFISVKAPKFFKIFEDKLREISAAMNSDTISAGGGGDDANSVGVGGGAPSYGAPSYGGAESLSLALTEFSAAAAQFDIDAMETALKKISGTENGWSKEVFAAIKKMQNSLLVGEYEEAQKTAMDMIQSFNN